ncbi:MAG: hypothetical protein QXI19_08310 [Candidatus Caldarchaeum sp.]
MTTLKRALLLLFALTLIAPTSGCVYLRLLETKKQLSAFSTYFDLKDDGGLKLIFKKPVLTGSDIIWLTRHNPSESHASPEGTTWIYVFRKIHATQEDLTAEGNKYDIPLKMHFANDRLSEVTFPERFLKFISIPLLKRMLESIGEAKVDRSEKAANSTFLGHSSWEIPTEKQIRLLLGSPTEIEEAQDGIILKYKYSLVDSTYSSHPDFETRFKVSRKDQRIVSNVGIIRGLKLAMEFKEAKQTKDNKGRFKEAL